jgi:hypothetical protein
VGRGELLSLFAWTRDNAQYSDPLLMAIGAVLRADVDGQILMRAYLSGTPECKFGLNDKLVLQKR